MSPELHRALVPKTTIARMIDIHAHNMVAWTVTMNLALAAYAETLRLFWGGRNATG